MIEEARSLYFSKPKKKISQSEYNELMEKAKNSNYYKYIKSDEYKKKVKEYTPKVKEIEDEKKEAVKQFNRKQKYHQNKISIVNLKYAKKYREDEIKHFKDKIQNKKI